MVDVAGEGDEVDSFVEGFPSVEEGERGEPGTPRQTGSEAPRPAMGEGGLGGRGPSPRLGVFGGGLSSLSL